MYTRDQVLQASKEYFNGDEMAAKVFTDKYSLRDEQDNYVEKTPDDLHHRLAKEFARIEKKYPNPLTEEEIFNLFKNFKYIIPQGSPMSAIGNNYSIQSTSNCFVIESPYDSYGGILKTDQEQAQIMKRRGGVGFDISTIRPKGVKTKNAAKTTDGIGLFMERFSNTTREVAQGGRRGALMLTISVHHPEIETFINIKRDKKKVTGANISVKVTDEFMTAVKENKEYEQRWPIDAKEPKITKKVNAREIWNQLIHAAWESAEPGILFWDTAEKYTPSDIYKEFGYGSVSTNPCGEIVLSPFDSCRLFTMNLLTFVSNPFTEKAKFDYVEFGEKVVIAQRLMDDMIDIELEKINAIIHKIKTDKEPEDVKKIELDLWNKIKKACENGRRTGLGITALGDTLASLGVKYGSDESVKVTEKIYKTLAINSYRSSVILAKERGAFPIFDHKFEKNHPFLQRIWDADSDLYNLYKKHGRRNIANTTTAPTGSVSIMTQTTSGIEPVFMVKYTRRKKLSENDKDVKPDFIDALGDRWQEFTVYHHQFKRWMDITGKDKVEDSPYFGAMANDIDWQSHVKIQSAAQKWIDHSISKTCNLPKTATEEQISEIYIKAWESGCKGFTVYRDGCRDGVLVSETKTDDRETKRITKTTAPKRPVELLCDIHHAKITKKLDKHRTFEYAVIVGLLHDEPYEIFVFENGHLDKKYTKAKLIKKSRGHYNLVLEDGKVIENIMDEQTEEEEMITRLASTALRHGTDISFLVHQLEKVKQTSIGSFTKVMARILKKYIKDGTKVSGETCSSCGSKNIIRKEGCLTCADCGNSKCG